jgi:hypothetical protein
LLERWCHGVEMSAIALTLGFLLSKAGTTTTVIAGLDPAIHHSKTLLKID